MRHVFRSSNGWAKGREGSLKFLETCGRQKFLADRKIPLENTFGTLQFIYNITKK